ncbi:MAG: ABC transporter permease [Chloroflexi bacterium]|nr:ABC transporter permease [Chloroflexota bacterium]MCI0579605.1 ABC transporter permease [Chloroflexota bacterium]MCI0644834.1 ABC transporter permease [Chloroflexota bacterium]MCI0731440.1 ABC transporter permease [Chloroflexota bacterium]
MKERVQLKYISLRYPYLFALALLVVAVLVNFVLQPNLFETRVLNGNMRSFLPLMLVTVGQAVVIIGGGIDLSVGAILSLVTAVLVTNMATDSPAGHVILVIAMAAGAGMAAGTLNGLSVAFLRLPPIVTTYATTFIFSGLALWILPRPGGSMPEQLARLYRQATPLGIPFGVWVAVLLVLLWSWARNSRYGNFLYAVGGKAEAAYATAVPVNRIRFSTYVFAGLMSALGALVLTLGTGSGDPRIGVGLTTTGGMTLDSIVAVVLGGTRLSGGQGGVAGSIMGVTILGLIRNIISFADVPSWYQTLVDALIIIVALAAPGLLQLVRRA